MLFTPRANGGYLLGSSSHKPEPVFTGILPVHIWEIRGLRTDAGPQLIIRRLSIDQYWFHRSQYDRVETSIGMSLPRATTEVPLGEAETSKIQEFNFKIPTGREAVVKTMILITTMSIA